MLRRSVPYAGALAVVAVITLVMLTLRAAAFDVRDGAVVYVLLVLLIGATYGRVPAVAAALMSFLAYDFFLVPPYGSLLVSGPRELLELLVLLASAVISGGLVANLRQAQTTAHAAQRAAEAGASELRELYRLATAAIGLPDSAAALKLLCARAKGLAAVRTFSLATVERGSARLIAGDELPPTMLTEAARAYKAGTSLRVILKEGRLQVSREYPGPSGPAMLCLSSGVAVFDLVDGGPEAELRLLAALVGLADLLLDRRRVALEAARAQALEASDQLKTGILSSLSHELKSPLAAIRAGLTSLLAPDAAVPTDQHELLAALDQQAARLDGMLGDLLVMSRLEAGMRSNLTPGSIDEVVGAVVGRLKSHLGAVEVRLAVPPHLPPVLMDEAQIDRVLVNLIENAVQWTDTGGTIEVGASAAASLTVWVENSGPAIPPSELDQVFSKFWTRREGGSGLGLAICQRIVEAHGGSIRVQNTRRGPRFSFTLQLANVAVTP